MISDWFDVEHALWRQNVDLQQYRRVVGRPASGCGVNSFEAEPSEIEFVDEDLNDPHRVGFTHIVVKALRKLRDLRSILAFDESLHAVARSDVATT